ncbi:MAG: protein-L-isoaspartate(D-aspartate) O-methyltransferase [Chitinophagaceae bacterium]|nr:MAG: protein-L-isoaspartate(D-aspartate) O-methyltransferase [Chitinophagaceae bacterium]
MSRAKEDTYKHKGLRKLLVETIIKKGIKDKRVLAAISLIPRHFFLDSIFDEIAYEDKAFPITAGQTISQPYTVAYQSELLDVEAGMKVLEIGTGSAYQAVILAAMDAKVFTIERQKKLYDENLKFEYLKEFSNIKFFYGDGYKGLPTYAPFDRIIITAAAPFIPTALMNQLKIGGKLVVPLGEGNVQQMQRITKTDVDKVKIESFENFSFVPMLQGKNT